MPLLKPPKIKTVKKLFKVSQNRQKMILRVMLLDVHYNYQQQSIVLSSTFIWVHLLQNVFLFPCLLILLGTKTKKEEKLRIVEVIYLKSGPSYHG